MSQRIIKNLKVIQKKIQKMTKIVLKNRNKKKKNNWNQKSIVQKVKRMKMKKKNWMMREIMIKSIELMMILMIQMKWMNNISKTMLLIINKTILAI